ncbi:PhnD/SsuA/transferrin family substrate-binding protein [Chroococcidiopsis sp. FACHB-1243]|uniref:phosphate/phosphite/phosphonate ABC transporter substrate-binding protein n=1 Tax=Chroococcidiopsis sp. [FACHB-1243] TaxID=2692781 RepID=UPI00177C37AB|nr:PhnD/SsuA/transferrin family substrate-binding protein [Chroococcidiopsis sp. [FACHB-1243]]MBD2305113.1 PhnD/SsuA/transferrin family substrate-binding protein [Chroococcidiopsis sp. [FACHB-1243]]
MPYSPGRTIILWSLIGFASTTVIAASILSIWRWVQPCAVGEKRFWTNCYRDLQAQPLKIGVSATAPIEDYQALATHLQEQLGVRVIVDRNTPFPEIRDRLDLKDWDIAFTGSPVLSIAAEDNNYVGVAVMYPDRPLYDRAALFVKADSKIKSIADIQPSTTIALGSSASALTFLIPIYALHGKTLKIGRGYHPREAINLVKTGKIDIAAGQYTAIKDDPTLRVIYMSKPIPGVGVYLSPRLLNFDRELIKLAMLNANAEIKAKAKYTTGEIPDYGELRKIIARAEEVALCLKSTQNYFNWQVPVNLFCQERSPRESMIRGRVEEYKFSNPGNIETRHNFSKS